MYAKIIAAMTSAIGGTFGNPKFHIITPNNRLLGVIIWNFGFPNVPPIADVIAAMILAYMSQYLKHSLKVN